MKLIVPAILLIGVVLTCNAQEVKETLIPYKKNDKWGYVNEKSKWVVKPIFQETFPFVEGRARVKQDGKYGFIDSSGEVVIAIRFNSANDFYQNQALVSIEDSLIVVDTIGVEYKAVLGCDGGIFRKCDYQVILENGLKGVVISYPKDTLIKPKYLDAKVFCEVSVFTVQDSTGMWALVSSKDSIIQPFIFEQIEMRNGYFVTSKVKSITGLGEDGLLISQKVNLYGALNTSGEIMAKTRYSEIHKYPRTSLFYTTLPTGGRGYIFKTKEYWKL